MSNEPVTLILGPARCGKDTASKLLSEQTGLKWATTSGLASWHMWRVFDALLLPYTDEQACYADRGRYRELWATCMAALNWADGSGFALYSKAVGDGFRILNGFRRLDELVPFVNWLHKHDYRVELVWVDASKRRQDDDKTMDYNCTDLCIRLGQERLSVLDNNKDEAALAGAVATLAEDLGLT